jgi:hypothetical protein
MFNYEVSIDDRHVVKLSASTPIKISKLLWSQTIASDISMEKIDYKIMEKEITTAGLPENLLLWIYDSDKDCEDFIVDTSVIDTEEKLFVFVDFIMGLYSYVHDGSRLEILRIDDTSSCNIM